MQTQRFFLEWTTRLSTTTICVSEGLHSRGRYQPHLVGCSMPGSQHQSVQEGDGVCRRSCLFSADGLAPRRQGQPDSQRPEPPGNGSHCGPCRTVETKHHRWGIAPAIDRRFSSDGWATASTDRSILSPTASSPLAKSSNRGTWRQLMSSSGPIQRQRCSVYCFSTNPCSGPRRTELLCKRYANRSVVQAPRRQGRGMM